MASLLDIAPADAIVTVKGVDVAVTGISARGFVLLLTRYPALQDLIGGKALSPAELAKFGGDVVAAIIAAGTGHPGEPAHEAAAEKLNAEAQLDLLSAIMKETLPNGIGPFVEKLADAGAVLGLGDVQTSAKGLATKSPAPSKT